MVIVDDKYCMFYFCKLNLVHFNYIFINHVSLSEFIGAETEVLVVWLVVPLCYAVCVDLENYILELGVGELVRPCGPRIEMDL